VVGPGGRVWEAAYLDGRVPRRRAAHVAIGQTGLAITLVESGTTFRWPLAQVRQTQGFYGDEPVRLERGDEALLVGDLAFLSALRAAAPHAASAFHAPTRRRFRRGLSVLAAAAALGVGGGLYAWGIPAVAGIAAAHVPVAWEVALGEVAMGQLAPAEMRCQDPERQRRIDEVMGVLLRTLPDVPYPFQVTVVDHPMVNAFAAPGGFIVIFRGLLERTRSAEELAGVLAHEIQHVVHRHATRAVLRQASTGILIAALVGDVGGVTAFGIEAARLLGDLRHSREAEHEADRAGMRMLQAAAVDPEGMLAFFRTVQALEGAAPAAARYLSTHPAPAERLHALRALAGHRGRRPAKLLPAYDWGDIKKICGRSRDRASRSRRGPPAPGALDGLADAAGEGRGPGEAHAQRRQRVVDGVDDRRRWRDRAALAQPLDAQGIAGGGVLQVLALDGGQVVGARQRVVHQRAGQQLAGVVVRHVLEKSSAHALGHPAVDLALDDDGVDHHAAIVGDHVAEQPHPARVGIDLDLRDVHGARVGDRGDVVVGDGVEVGAGHPGLREGRDGGLDQATE
jgi:Zn-dependent protease with chaperone function